MANDPGTVEACYLYPVKGMTPLEADALQLEAGRSPLGDRAFIFAFADADLQGDRGWVSKREAVTLLTTPELAQVTSRYDAEARRLILAVPGRDEASANVDKPAEREALAAWLAEVVNQFPSNPLSGRPEREPLQLLGDGETLFTDRGPSQISIGGRESLRELSERAGANVDERRFRSNLMVSGIDAWQEFEWPGRQFRLGEAVIEVTAPLRRCNAINASPEGNGRDLDLTKVLQREYGHINFGVEANVIKGGQVRPGDTMTVAN